MKILYLFRDSPDAKYILHKLSVDNLVDGVIIETGKSAKKRKLKRIIKNTPFYKYPLMFLDIVFLLIYAEFSDRNIKKKLGSFEYPEGKILLAVDDINEKEAVDKIKSENPDVIFIFGTAILKREFLSSIKAKIFNIHTGILPNYRNVHSDFWAMFYKDYENIGVSIIEVDPGVDEGAIVEKKSISIQKNDDIFSVKIKNLKLVVELVKKIISQKKFISVKQSDSFAGVFSTPGIFDLLRLFFFKK